jgi:hypothetical protein
MQKDEKHFPESKSKKISENENFCRRSGLKIATKVGLCHRSGLKYLSHGFQTQGTVAARAGLRVRPESTCVPGPWISDPRYGARVLRVLGPLVHSVKTTCS